LLCSTKDLKEMVIHISSFTFSGIEIIDVDVQVQITAGMPSFTIVGLADKTIGESRERVKAALSSMGIALPAKRILINLAPADLIKEGSHFDLPIACGVLASMGILAADQVIEYLIAGELSLDGSILPISGVLPAAIGANQRGRGLICPVANGKEAAWSGNNDIVAAHNLISLVNHFKGTQVIAIPKPELRFDTNNYLDIADIQGQEVAKRVLEIAAAGEHNLIMSGPPGAGKSMLAQRLPGILPEMSSNEILECSTVASIAGLIKDGQLTSSRPFRSPHHSCSMAAMVGGGVGKRVKPGEISLAHNGVLFLDELPEFPNNVIESLRQPIESGKVLISRANSHVTYPARFQLIAAMNPCKCGYLGDNSRSCGRDPKCGIDYQNKISGPIMDRFDLSIEVPAMDFAAIQGSKSDGEVSVDVKNRVISAREIQRSRYEGYGIATNGRMDGQLLIDFATPSDGSIDLLNEAAQKFKLSMRAYNRILRVSRTIADLENTTHVKRMHIVEALNYRQINYGQSIAA
jgi:magnesium chelatase family protein